MAGAFPGLPGEGGEPSGLGRVRGAALVSESPLMAQVPGPRPLRAECWLIEGVTLLACIFARGDCWLRCFSELVALEGLG